MNLVAPPSYRPPRHQPPPGRVFFIKTVVEHRAVFAERMLGVVSHDLRTPLLAISMAAELLGRRQQSAESQELLEHITHCAARAQRLVEDLLDFTVIRSGRGLSIQPAVLDLREAVAGCLEELRLTFPQRQLAYEHLGDGCAVFDKDRLYQLIGNLVSNALAYGDRHSVVTVTSRLDETQATVSVHNLGAPIPASQLKQLFDPMVRGRQQHPAMRNAGFGLYIVRQIARAHGGEVRVISTEREGTTFTVTFPRRAATFPHSVPGNLNKLADGPI
ncbi:sensor histidine kinase KdpD [Pseudomonas sp. Irchel 3E13]|uniref:sensor histidine kinase n=1 Tax=Pseudomonas sp. Irchel 3E13 TaxID=2008975 RepID=UPI002114004A|nr:HAMP domain-containing sensor histidine kinase [Pseudomonas sp. Irchel 3E13]